MSNPEHDAEIIFVPFPGHSVMDNRHRLHRLVSYVGHEVSVALPHKDETKPHIVTPISHAPDEPLLPYSGFFKSPFPKDEPQ